jgi:hypothetical protein
MSVTFDPADDFPAVIDRVEPVLLYPAGSGSSISISSALRRAQAVSERAGSGGRVTASEARWHLYVTSLGHTPAIGDRIVDAAGGAWTILQVALVGNRRFVCQTRDLVMLHGLCERVDIQRAVWTKDAAGAARATWHLWRSGLRARIQPHDAVATSADARDHLAATHRVLLAEPLAVDENCRVVGPDGKLYRIVAHHPAASLDALDELVVVADVARITGEELP